VATTVEAEITIPTTEVRDALRSVLPHVNKLITDDHDAEHRVRLTFAQHHLFLTASNGHTTGLAKVHIVEDSRQERFAADDGPIVVDITPRRARLILQQFKAKPSDPEVGQLMQFNVEPEGLSVSDIGGLWSAGEVQRYPVEDPAEAFPDVLAITSRALAGVGASQVGKALVTDGRVLALFRDASRVYGQPLQVESTGTPESRGFMISCGPDFLGTVSSSHNDDDSLKKRDRNRRAWLELLPAQKLAVV
jgi:hypothetical protein